MAAKSKKRKSTKQTKKNTQQSFVRDEINLGHACSQHPDADQ
jgi:hypothetical protein